MSNGITRKGFLGLATAAVGAYGIYSAKKWFDLSPALKSMYIEDIFSDESSAEKKLEKKYEIRIIGDTSLPRISFLEHLLDFTSSTLDEFNKHMKNVRFIEVAGRNLGINSWDATTCCIYVEDWGEYFLPHSFAHELGHAHYSNLPKAELEDFLRKWDKTAPDGFLDILKQKLMEKGKDMSAYTEKEVICKTIEDSYWMRLHLLDGGSQNDFRTTAVPWTFYEIKDIIGTENMLERLALLAQYGFMSQREYKIMKPLTML